MNISLQGFNAKHATFAVSGDVEAGKVVSVKETNTIKTAAANDAFLGVAVSVNSGYALVQTSGFVTLPYSGATAPSYGQQILAADANGGVAVASAGRTVMVCGLDTTNKTVSFLF